MDVVDSIHEWAAELRRHLPLSGPQARVLGAWSVGVALAQGCGQTVVSELLAAVLGQKAQTVRQRLREFCYEAKEKRGVRRRTLEVERCFAGLLGWVLSRWEGRRLALALDATSLKQEVVVLCVSVLFRGTALPVAWHVVRAAQPEAWGPHWRALLNEVSEAVPEDYFVLVLTDRGLYSPELFGALVERGWHPAMRINAGGYFTPEGEAPRPIAEVPARPGESYHGRGTAFKERPIACSLLACWDKGHAEPWRVVTDLPPEAARVQWYALRGWIEQGFKDLKRGGLQWQGTRMQDPARVQRFWLVLAVTALWKVSLGAAEDEAPPPEECAPSGPAVAASKPRPRPRRRVSVFLRGTVCLLADLVLGRVRPRLPRLVPEPWSAPAPSLPSNAPGTALCPEPPPLSCLSKLSQGLKKTYP
jgi:hypothetical protein